MQVHKITLTVIDFDNLGASGVQETLERTRFPNDCISPHVYAIESRDIGEWRDDNPLNRASTFRAEVERLFGTIATESAAAAPRPCTDPAACNAQGCCDPRGRCEEATPAAGAASIDTPEWRRLVTAIDLAGRNGPEDSRRDNWFKALFALVKHTDAWGAQQREEGRQEAFKAGVKEGITATYVLDPTDTTSADNGGTIIQVDKPRRLVRAQTAESALAQRAAGETNCEVVGGDANHGTINVRVDGRPNWSQFPLGGRAYLAARSNSPEIEGIAARAVGGVDVSIIKQRRPYYEDRPDGYLESDNDYVLNNVSVAVKLLDAALLASAPAAHTTEAAPVVSTQAPVVAAPVGGLNVPAAFSCAKAEPNKYFTACKKFCGNHLTCMTTERKFPNEHDSRVMFEAWVKSNLHQYYQETHRLREIIEREGPGYKDSRTNDDYQGWCAAWKAFSALLAATPVAPVGDGDERTFAREFTRWKSLALMACKAIEKQLSPEWECNSNHPTLQKAVDTILAALTQQKG